MFTSTTPELPPSDRFPCTFLIPLFALLSLVAFLLSAGGVLYFILHLNDYKGSFARFCDDILFFMFALTAIYLLCYVLIVMADRVYGVRSSGGENFFYIIYSIAVGGFALASFSIKYSLIQLNLLNNLTPVYLIMYETILPSTILSFLLLAFDIIIISRRSFRNPRHDNDRYWGTVFAGGWKLDLVIFLGFCLMFVILFGVDSSGFEVPKATLTIFITGCEIMLFMVSTCVFTLDALLPSWEYFRRRWWGQAEVSVASPAPSAGH